MARFACYGALVAFVAVSLSCSDHTETTAPSPPRPAVSQTPTPARPLPPLTGAITTYRFSKPLLYPVNAYTQGSSFVLYESGGFYLQYDAFAHRYHGGYEQDGERILFYFGEGDSTPDAIGTLIGDLLEVRYSDRMQHSDFENAVYQR